MLIPDSLVCSKQPCVAYSVTMLTVCQARVLASSRVCKKGYSLALKGLHFMRYVRGIESFLMPTGSVRTFDTISIVEQVSKIANWALSMRPARNFTITQRSI